MEFKKFYNVHYDAMYPAQLNLIIYIDRLIERGVIVSKKSIRSLIKLASSAFSGGIMKNGKLKNKQAEVKNLLSFMGSSVLYNFLFIEFYLRYEDQILDSETNNIIGTSYNKMVLCPLETDLGNINNNDVFYGSSSQKTISGQIKDLMTAVKMYYANEIEIEKDRGLLKPKIVSTKQRKEDRLLEIYPFMGINTKNYDLASIKKMMNKYFYDFRKEDTQEERHEKLFAAMGEFNGDLEDIENCKNIFAGIKLYPRLGFDPWPICKKCGTNEPCGCEEEREKVRFLYKTCIDKGIPIITHYNMGEAVVGEESAKSTNLSKQWADVLEQEEFNALRICFAHLGIGNEQCKKKLIELACDEKRNVFIDISCTAVNDDFYKKLKTRLGQNKRLIDKILFGSDFMNNLQELKSSREYLKNFLETEHLSQLQKEKLSNRNPSEFLFGSREKQHSEPHTEEKKVLAAY